MRHGRAAELCHPLDAVARRNEVDRDRVGIAGHRQGRRLARLVDERFELRARHRPDVDPEQDQVAEVDEPDARADSAPVRGSRSA